MEAFFKRRPISINRNVSPSSSLLVLFLLLSPLITVISAVNANDGNHGSNGEGENNRESTKEKQENEKGWLPIESAIGISTGLSSRWETLKTWAKLALIGLRPPDSAYGNSGSSAEQVLKKAASTSFETSKETVKHSAASVVKVAEEAVQKTKQAVQKTVAGQSEDSNAEL